MIDYEKLKEKGEDVADDAKDAYKELPKNKRPIVWALGLLGVIIILSILKSCG